MLLSVYVFNQGGCGRVCALKLSGLALWPSGQSLSLVARKALVLGPSRETLLPFATAV